LKKQNAAMAQQKNEHDKINIASVNSDVKKDYGVAYGTTDMQVPSNYVQHPGTIVPISEQLSSSPMYLKQENPTSMEMGMFQHLMQSPQTVGQMQQGIMHSHMYGYPPSSSPLFPAKTYLPQPEFRYPNVFPGIKLHDGYIGFYGNQASSSCSTKVSSYPSGAVCYPSQMFGDASTPMGESSGHHASVAWPPQTFMPGT
jgi:hypothetical protein